MASIRKRGETFTITAYMGYDEQGRQRKKTTTYRPPDGVTAGKAEKLAKAYAATWEEKIRGYIDLDENRTFAELAEWYYTSVAPSVLKPNVLENYRGEIERHIMPRLGREKLKNITPPMLDGLFAELLQSGNLETHYRLIDNALLDGMTRQAVIDKSGVDRATLYNILRGNTARRETAEKIAAALDMPLDKVFVDATEKRGLSGSTVGKIKLNLSAIFTAAVKKEIMRRNPCTLATPPKNDTPPAAYLDEQQSRVLLQALHDYGDFQFEVFCNLMLATGLRPGECTALHWDDIDLQTGLLYVHYTLIRSHGEFQRQTPKTAQSERRLVLPAYIIGLLEQHKAQQAGKPNKHGSVFCNRAGDYVNSINLNARLKRAIAGTGLPDIHLHSLRHTHASLLINGNVTAKIIADRLGHANTNTTLNVYSHVFAESEVKAMQAVEMALFTQKTK
jgi:integrase